MVRRVSTSKQTGDDDVLVHQPSTEVSQQGTVAQCHGGNDASEHTNETVFSPELSTSVVHGEVVWCVLTLQRTPVEQRLQARPAPTGPGLRLTAMPRPNLSFNGRHPRDPWNYMDDYSFPDPGGMEGRVGLVGWLTADALPTKWSHVNHGSGVDQGKSASYRPTS